MSEDATNLLTVPQPTTRQQSIALRRELRKQLFIGLLTNSSATLYTAPAAPTVANSVGVNPVTTIENVWIANTDSSARTVTLYLVESGGSIGANRTVFPTVSVPANSVVEINPGDGRGWVLEASGTLRGLASVTSVVNILVSGTEHLV